MIQKIIKEFCTHVILPTVLVSTSILFAMWLAAVMCNLIIK